MTFSLHHDPGKANLLGWHAPKVFAQDFRVLSKRGGKVGVFQGLAGLLRGISWGTAALPAEENPVLADSFTQSYILFIIGFRIDPPKMHREFRIGLHKIHGWFRIGPPKIHRRFRIGPPQVSLNLLPPEFHRRGIMLTIANMTEKQQNNLFEI